MPGKCLKMLALELFQNFLMQIIADHMLAMLVNLSTMLQVSPPEYQWRSEGNWRPGAKLNFAPPPLKIFFEMILKCQ